MILALSDANERSRIAPIDLAVSAAFWTVPPVALTVVGASATAIMLLSPYQPSDFGSFWPDISYAKRSHNRSA